MYVKFLNIIQVSCYRKHTQVKFNVQYTYMRIIIAKIVECCYVTAFYKNFVLFLIVFFFLRNKV